MLRGAFDVGGGQPCGHFGTAFVPTGQPEIICVAADVRPLPLKNRPQNNEPIHPGGYDF